jgi:hypothetical protein
LFFSFSFDAPRDGTSPKSHLNVKEKILERFWNIFEFTATMGSAHRIVIGAGNKCYLVNGTSHPPSKWHEWAQLACTWYSIRSGSG